MRRKNQWLWLGIALGIAGVYAVVRSYRSVPLSSQIDSALSLHKPTLAVSELPGYTGWARPASTLAGLFRIKQQDKQAVVYQNWTVTVTCDGCSDDDHPWFYVRAYGPAILTGVVEQAQQGSMDYSVALYPVVAGQYTVEFVLTYSHPKDPDAFPLTNEQLPPPYFEGYLLPDFPLQLTVTDSSAVAAPRNLPYCTVEHLTVSESSTTKYPSWKQPSWRVTSTNKQMHHHSDETAGSNVTLEGYQWGRNSLGFTAAYEYTDCRLIERLGEEVVQVTTCPKAAYRLHIILVGDSVMRLQKEWIEQQLSPDKVVITFMEIYGGALRCARLSGPNVTQLQAPVSDAASGRTIVVVNTGMHDIHRLCGHHWIDDRPNYLTETELKSSCTTMYRTAIRELVLEVQKIPAAVHIFQTTTAAWPKYGNYGVAWDPRYAQELPLDSAFVERFNQIAVDEIKRFNVAAAATKPRIQVVDAYWITLARPDNRETNKKADIGKKLSHPGLEVISHMVRIWWQTAVQLLCMS
jgi:hypothetical protein